MDEYAASEYLKDNIRKFYNPEEEELTGEEVGSIIEDAYELGKVGEGELEMFANIIEMDELDAKDIMSHRMNIKALDVSTTFEEALKFVIGESYSRFPVYDENLDDIKGVIHIREFLTFATNTEVYGKKLSEIESLIKKVDFVPETIGIKVLLRRMLDKKNHLAIVIDEYGQTSGLVSLEDILEEIVGNILDEHDKEKRLITKQKDGSFLCDGAAEMEDLLKVLEVEKLSEEEFDTISGYLISLIDKIPVEGETYEVQDSDFNYKIVKVQDNMIKKIIIKKL